MTELEYYMLLCEAKTKAKTITSDPYIEDQVYIALKNLCDLADEYREIYIKNVTEIKLGNDIFEYECSIIDWDESKFWHEYEEGAMID